MRGPESLSLCHLGPDTMLPNRLPVGLARKLRSSHRSLVTQCGMRPDVFDPQRRPLLLRLIYPSSLTRSTRGRILGLDILGHLQASEDIDVARAVPACHCFTYATRTVRG
jgi:hypothetical protein